MPERDLPAGWGWFEPLPSATSLPDELCRAAAACFTGHDGDTLLRHLQRAFLARRLPPTASDAELRHVEGQRSVVAHLLTLIERGRDPAGSARNPKP